MSEVTDALIVAGGKGTRLQPLTHDLPKPLLPFCGAPFLAGVIRRLSEAGIGRVHLVVGADTAPFEVLRPMVDVDLMMVAEPEPLDTAGGVRVVADDLDRPFVVLNGDILSDVDLRAVIDHHLRTAADATLVLTRVDDTSSYGVAVREGTRVVRFVEKPPPGSLPGQDAINAGTYVLEPKVLLAHQPGRLSFERQVFPDLLARGGHIEGYVSDGVWADLGTPDRYLEGHRLALSDALDWPSLHDVPERGPGRRVAEDADVHPRAQLVGPVLILGGATVGADAVVGPDTVVGRGARIDAGATVARSVLHDGVHLGAELVVDGLIAGSGASIAAGAVMGRRVVLGAGEVVDAGGTLDDGARRPPPRD